jgi:hypothetical protein
MKTKTMKTKTMKTKTMKTKSILSLTCALVLLCFGGQANAALVLTNGNFTDTTDLISVGDGWYSGVPTGWSSAKPDTSYSVLQTGDTYVANLSQLTRSSPEFNALTQNVGTTDYFGDVTLKFDMSNFTNSTSWHIGVAIWSNNYDSLLATRQIKHGELYAPVPGDVPNGIGTFELTALNVAAGSDIQIGFWAANGASAVSNVSIIPEPSSYALMLGGIASLLLLRLLRPRVQS